VLLALAVSWYFSSTISVYVLLSSQKEQLYTAFIITFDLS